MSVRCAAREDLRRLDSGVEGNRVLAIGIAYILQVHAFLHFSRPQDRFCASLGFHIMSERVLFYHARWRSTARPLSRARSIPALKESALNRVYSKCTFLHFLRPQDRFCAALGFHIMSERVLFYHAR